MTVSGESTLTDRVWARDESLWGGPGVPEIADRLGWLDIADRMVGQLPEIEAWVAEVHAAGLTNTVLLGMGGSSLGPEVLSRSFGGTLTMLDSTDPRAVLDAVAADDLPRTIFVVSSKSGSTIETLSHFRYFHELTGRNGAQFCAVTDPGSPLEQLAREQGFRRVWTADPQIGGRYSVLGHFGLIPAALAGVPLAGLLDRAVRAAGFCRASHDNPGFSLGEKIGSLALAGRDKLTFVVDPPVESFGLWVEQLVAESTGKHGKGVLPVAGEPVAPPKLIEQYGNDRAFVHIANGGKRDLLNAASIDAIEQAGHPVFRLAVNSPEDLGPLMFIFEFAVAVAGHVLGINPFDQPDVQQAKDATRRVLDAGTADPPFDDPATLAALLGDGAPPAYFAIMGYVAPDPDFDRAAEDLRRKIRALTGAATTFGYGPRYLHSTGQLHKGGPPEGRFIQLIHDGSEDVPVPGEEFSFRTLKHAQAAGDLEALRGHGRPVVRLELKGDPAESLRALTKNLG
jgi:glucose-6-phosphate isomerase